MGSSEINGSRARAVAANSRPAQISAHTLARTGHRSRLARKFIGHDVLSARVNKPPIDGSSFTEHPRDLQSVGTFWGMRTGVPTKNPVWPKFPFSVLFCVSEFPIAALAEDWAEIRKYCGGAIYLGELYSLGLIAQIMPWNPSAPLVEFSAANTVPNCPKALREFWNVQLASRLVTLGRFEYAHDF